jgi:hypothetical protein
MRSLRHFTLAALLAAPAAPALAQNPPSTGSLGPLRSDTVQEKVYGADDRTVIATDDVWFEYSVSYALKPTSVTENKVRETCGLVCQGGDHAKHADCDGSCSIREEGPHNIHMAGRFESVDAGKRLAENDARRLARGSGASDWTNGSTTNILRQWQAAAGDDVTMNIPHWHDASCSSQEKVFGLWRHDFEVTGTMTRHATRRQQGATTPMPSTVVGRHSAVVAYVWLPTNRAITTKQAVVKCVCKTKPKQQVSTDPRTPQPVPATGYIGTDKTPTFSGLGLTDEEKAQAAEQYKKDPKNFDKWLKGLEDKKKAAPPKAAPPQTAVNDTPGSIIGPYPGAPDRPRLPEPTPGTPAGPGPLVSYPPDRDRDAGKIFLGPGLLDSKAMWQAARIEHVGRTFNPSLDVFSQYMATEQATVAPRSASVSRPMDVIASIVAWLEAPFVRLAAAEPTSVAFALIANGQASGPAFELQALNGSGTPVAFDIPDGLILMPTKEKAEKAAAALIKAKAPKMPFNAYCVDFAKKPPTLGVLYSIAPQDIQQKFASVKNVVQAGREALEKGLLQPDSDPGSYGTFIKQWSVWTRLEKWNADSFKQEFLQRTKANMAALGRPWTKQLEAAVAQAAPGRWRDVETVLRRADAVR